MKANKVIKVITTYVSHGEEFKIVKENDFDMFGAINTKYITNGRLNKPLFNHEIYLSETIQKCIERVEWDFGRKEYQAQGYGSFASIILADGGTVEEAEENERIMNEYLSKCK